MNPPRRDPADSLWRPDRRALTLGLVLTITLVGFEALAVSTVMPIVARELGGIELYGWVFSAFFLGSLIGIVIVGGAIDRGGLALPFAVGLGLFAIGLLSGGLAPSMVVLVVARFVQGLGAGTIQPIAYVAIGRTLPEIAPSADVRDAVDRLGPARRHRTGDRGHGRRVDRLAVRLPRAAPADRARRCAHARRAAGRRASAQRPSDPETAPARGRRLPLALIVALGAGLFLVGLTSDAGAPDRARSRRPACSSGSGRSAA